MGVSNSKPESCEALRLCKKRKKFIKQAIDSRYNLAAAHVVYVQSLENIGIALRKFAEAEVPLESSSSTTDAQNASSPSPPQNVRLSYMKSGGAGAVTVISNANKVYVDDVESLSMSPPLPPPPPPPFSWDYFNPRDGSFRFVGDDGFRVNSNEQTDTGGYHEPLKKDDNQPAIDAAECDSNSKDGCLIEEETEFMTQRAKDFVSSIKDIENGFSTASKSGDEVSRMLEANKIQVSYSQAKGASSLSLLTCFAGESALVLHEADTPKVITWKRSTSHPPSDDDNQNNFTEELCMIAGSHSSTLDRLYAWERKLYDEVKASESIRKEYDRKCDQLRHQFAKDLKPHLIDKTRAKAKDLHSRLTVALHTVDSISKRIEKMRDQELQPQLIELIQGLIRMWRSMLGCHHAQYITCSLAYHPKTSRTQTHQDETKKQVMTELQHEIECFGLSFTDLVNCYTSYVESINGWLHNCIIQPKERVKGRRAFSPRRAVAPPIFVICRDWSTGFRNLPSQKLSDVIKDFLCHLRRLSVEEFENKQTSFVENGEEAKNGDARISTLSSIQSSLTKVLDRLTKFSEASLKMYEDIKENSETAGNVYSNYRPPPRAFSI